MKPGSPKYPGVYFFLGLALQVSAVMMFIYQPHVLIVWAKLTRLAEKFDTAKLFPRLSRFSGLLQVNLMAYVHFVQK